MTTTTPAVVEVQPDPRLEQRTCCGLGAAEKPRLLTEPYALLHGEQHACLRRNGLYAAPLPGWRTQHADPGLAGLQPQSPGRKGVDPRERQIQALARENARLQRRAEA